KTRAVRTRLLDRLQVRLQLALVHRRTHLNARLAAVADLERARTGDERLGDFGDDAGRGDDARGGRATLASRSECALEDAGGGQLHVRIVEDDDGILSTHLARHLDAAACRALVQLEPDCVRAREAHRLDARIVDESIA